jgi:hypothetical protein
MASLGGDLQTLLFNFTFCSAKAEVKTCYKMLHMWTWFSIQNN